MTAVSRIHRVAVVLVLSSLCSTGAKFNSSRLLDWDYDPTAAPDNKPIQVLTQCSLISVPIIDEKSGEIEIELKVRIGLYNQFWFTSHGKPDVYKIFI